MNAGFWISAGVYSAGTIMAAGLLLRAMARIKAKVDPAQKVSRPPSDSFEAPKEGTGHDFPNRIGAAHP